MSTESPKALHGAHRQLEPARHIVHGDEAEIVRADCGQQLKPDIRRRRTHRHDGRRIVLEVVRREPVGRVGGETIVIGPVEPRVVEGR